MYLVLKLTIFLTVCKLNMSVTSAGFLIDCFGKYLICHSTCLDGSFSKHDQQWGVPKGIVENRDSLLATAVRETFEETGLDLFDLHDSGLVKINHEIKFKYKTTKKTVHVFYAKAKIDITLRPLKCISKIMPHNLPENDAFMWVDWNTAHYMVSKRQKSIFCSENLEKIVAL